MKDIYEYYINNEETKVYAISKEFHMIVTPTITTVDIEAGYDLLVCNYIRDTHIKISREEISAFLSKYKGIYNRISQNIANIVLDLNEPK